MNRRTAFTLIELLVVIAIISILAAIIFPVFARAKSAAKQTACISNLRQIGAAITEYMADSDDVFPHAVDPADKFQPDIWNSFPEFRARIPLMPMLHEALQPYIKNTQVFKCPGDTGIEVLENSFPMQLVGRPTMFATFGTSYFFRTEIAFRAFTSTLFKLPSDVNVLFDGAGHWHGSGPAVSADDDFDTYREKIKEFRYNTLFGDMHVKSLSYNVLQQAWSVNL